MFTRALKYTVVLWLIILLYFCIVNPWGCNGFKRDLTMSYMMKARRLYVELRRLESNGLDPWPRSPKELEEDSKSLQGGVYTSSVAFFEWLLRVGCDPENRERITCGVPFCVVSDDTDAQITSDNVMWSVAEGVDDETPDCAIVLVSANFDCSQLLSAYDGNADVPMVTRDGKRAVFVRKSGGVDSVEPKYLNARNIYHRQAFSGGPKSYLTPKGRVCTAY